MQLMALPDTGVLGARGGLGSVLPMEAREIASPRRRRVSCCRQTASPHVALLL